MQSDTSQYQQRMNAYSWCCSLFVVIGSLLYGIHIGTIFTTITQSTFTEYFGLIDAPIKRAIISGFNTGAFFGVMLASLLADRWGRKNSIWFAAFVVLIAGGMQAVSVNTHMLVCGRIIGGFGIGILNLAIPIYNAEISPSSKRGLIIGFHGLFISIGFCLASWISFALSSSHGQLQWRLPFAVQCIPAFILIIGLYWVPCSPRWLLKQGRYVEAHQVMLRLCGEYELDRNELFEFEFLKLEEQIDYERNCKRGGLINLIRIPGNRQRLLISIGVQIFAQLTGVSLMNNYHIGAYHDFGISHHSILLLSAIFASVGIIFNLVGICNVDKLGRRSTLWISTAGLMVCACLTMMFTALYEKSDNSVGKGIIIGFRFWFFAIFCLGYNSVQYVYPPEIMNQETRALGVAISLQFGIGISIILDLISSVLLERLGWTCYLLFIVTNIIDAVLLYKYFPETKGKSLEEINELFGDVIISKVTNPIYYLEQESCEEK
ncbi:general substrate transporter [Lipomyces japonicus]|uniref:general substrate transporter n=1 Tax=Lipomyces japonicus TaxID=56871 RepID=UPI0034CFBDA8